MTDPMKPKKKLGRPPKPIGTHYRTMRIAVTLPEPVAKRLRDSAETHATTPALLLDAMIRNFENMHPDWQGAMIRGETMPGQIPGGLVQ